MYQESGRSVHLGCWNPTCQHQNFECLKEGDCLQLANGAIYCEVPYAHIVYGSKWQSLYCESALVNK
jgi:hypothetical protein